MGKKNRKKSEFQKQLEAGFRAQTDMKMSEEKRKELRYNKLERIFNEFGDNKNRYLLYCPDIPFACTLVRTVYEHARLLNDLGFNAQVIHEVKGFKPSYLKLEETKGVTVHYLQEKDKLGKLSKPDFSFLPTDSIIIPDGFWTVMTGFVNTKTLHKIVLATGYGGFYTAEPGANWSTLGFTDVLCLSEQLKEDYSKLWPELNYHVTGYSIDRESFKPLNKTEIQPSIALSCRNREDAQALINIFYSKYPFLDLFQFRVLKKLDVENYTETLKRSSCLVFVDEKSGHPAPPLEALASNVPTIAVYGRGMEHLAEQEGMIWTPTNDLFILAEVIAEFCINWLENNVAPINADEVLKKYDVKDLKTRLLSVTKDLQNHKVKLFTAIKTAVDSGKLDETMLDDLSMPLENKGAEETKMSVVK